ncbi:hypothetical protein GOBAR_DD05124 [Gossypium barbadense]|nr:hypothetical protein GOBAR_DD05124 [Gossypium barbadense]
MSCFSCCEEDDIHKASGNGSFMANTPANTGGYGYQAREAVTRDPRPVTIQPIAIPAITVDELKEMTDNFGMKSLIGEGSYGRVYYGILKSGKAAAIKKLDSSKQPEQEFLAQVGPLQISLHSILSLILIGPKTMCWMHADVNAIAHGRRGGGGRTYCCCSSSAHAMQINITFLLRYSYLQFQVLTH